MTIQQMRYFLVLAKELHFWKTSEKVHISQSSLSRQIQSLEGELGFKLLERDKRNVELTEAGTFIQQRWELLLNELNQTHREAKKISAGTSGVISIAYPGSISFDFLPNLIKKFAEEMPDLKIELTEPTDINHEKLILDHHIDIAFSRDIIVNPTIASSKLYSEPICLVVAENHWLNKDNFEDLRTVRDENFIISALHHTTFFASLLRQIFNTYGFEPKTSIESDFGGMILKLVSQNLGISILPYSFQFATDYDVRFINLSEKVDLFINWRKNDQSQIVKNVLNHSIELGKKYDL